MNRDKITKILILHLTVHRAMKKKVAERLTILTINVILRRLCYHRK